MKRIAMKLKIAAAFGLLALAPVPAGAQNSSADPSTPSTSAPKADSAPTPSSTITTPAPVTTVPVTVEPVQPVVVQPAPAPVQQAPITIAPDAAYPNGFADPADPFANDLALANRNREGFPWGLLGLLGLLGLIPLLRGDGRVRTVYVERDEDPRRVARRERIED
jgi:hypothetical protein